MVDVVCASSSLDLNMNDLDVIMLSEENVSDPKEINDTINSKNIDLSSAICFEDFNETNLTTFENLETTVISSKIINETIDNYIHQTENAFNSDSIAGK